MPSEPSSSCRLRLSRAPLRCHAHAKTQQQAARATRPTQLPLGSHTVQEHLAVRLRVAQHEYELSLAFMQGSKYKVDSLLASAFLTEDRIIDLAPRQVMAADVVAMALVNQQAPSVWLSSDGLTDLALSCYESGQALVSSVGLQDLVFLPRPAGKEGKPTWPSLLCPGPAAVTLYRRLGTPAVALGHQLWSAVEQRNIPEFRQLTRPSCCTHPGRWPRLCWLPHLPAVGVALRQACARKEGAGRFRLGRHAIYAGGSGVPGQKSMVGGGSWMPHHNPAGSNTCQPPDGLPASQQGRH